MESMTRKQRKFPVMAWLLTGLTTGVVIVMAALSYRIYEVFVDPLTVGHRWTIIDNEYKSLLSLALLVFMLVPTIRLSFLHAKVKQALENSSKSPMAWSAFERAVAREEECDGRIAQRYPQFLSHMVKAFEAPCMRGGVMVKALVIARHKSLVLFAPLEDPMFFLGEMNDKGWVSGSRQFPKISQAIEAFLGQVVGKN